MKTNVFIFFLFLVVALSCNSKNSDSYKQPNMVFIIGDDVGWNDFGCYGNEGIKTPNIDRMAAEGLLFNNAFLTASSCSPSRCSIITGRYPHNTGAAELHSPLPDNQVLFPEILKAHGYYTAQAGKWHFGGGGLGPAVRAFDRKSTTMQQNGNGGEDMWIKFLEERPKDKPFFMWFASYDSHRPWGADEFQVTNNPDDVWIPEFLFEGERTRGDLSSYYNEITRLDYFVGTVENELERQGIAENTIIIVTSDNGRPFPRSKTRVYDSGMKTPLLIKWPARIERGVTTEALVSVIDLAPTLLELAGVQPGKTFQGKSFVRLFDHSEEDFRHFVFSEHNWHDYEAFERQVRTKDFMYIINKRPQFDSWGPADAVVSPSMKELYAAYRKDGLNQYQTDIFIKPRPEEELYVCASDPFQFTNLADNPEYKEVKEKLAVILDKWQMETGDNCPENLTPDHFDRKTGKRLFGGFRWGEMPGASLGADTITAKGPF